MSSIGIKLPITYNTGDGFMMITSLKGMVEQNLKMVLLTVPGERIMEPKFGVGLKRYLFKNHMEGTGDVRNKINEQVALYLPMISIDDIGVRSSPDANSMDIFIKYSIPELGIKDLLEFTI